MYTRETRVVNLSLLNISYFYEDVRKTQMQFVFHAAPLAGI